MVSEELIQVFFDSLTPRENCIINDHLEKPGDIAEELSACGYNWDDLFDAASLLRNREIENALHIYGKSMVVHIIKECIEGSAWIVYQQDKDRRWIAKQRVVLDQLCRKARQWVLDDHDDIVLGFA